jgi:hypothetical protein
MDKNTVFARTPKGNDEVENRTHKINIRLRAALLAVNGSESVEAIIKRFHGLQELATSLQELQSQGFIVPVAPARGGAAAGARGTFDQKLRAVVSLVHELLGPSGDAITERLEELGESFKQAAPVMQFLEQRRELFEGVVGKQKTQAFYEQARKLLG